MQFLVSVKLMLRWYIYSISSNNLLNFQALAIVVINLMMVMVTSKPYHPNEIKEVPKSDKETDAGEGVGDTFQGMVVLHQSLDKDIF